MQLYSSPFLVFGVQMGGSPGHAGLAPISLSGSKPLPNIGGLPPLKARSTLAPLHPSMHSGTVSSLGGSLSSTAGSRLTDTLAASSNRGDGLGNIDVGTIRISTTFEEEDEESESESVRFFLLMVLILSFLKSI